MTDTGVWKKSLISDNQYGFTIPFKSLGLVEVSYAHQASIYFDYKYNKKQ